jgi:predicted DNA-binding protein (MmcQ/YjbR family)
MQKGQWNTVIRVGSLPKGEIEPMIDNSFSLVVAEMTKKDLQSILLDDLK